ncbi:hypothetical protein G6F57_001688 [Rhizopus arrhizus]|uniref:Uncharacterized protein n=1 Tax=Rhizopus oryzae TaxID=64495 RepID=A0A9P6XI06_RHIOR|nr:hypothetical protein G6F23_000197 [Rhizopus arrhizus]KAG1427735.1 hypothetical protein G6F58_000886 [Rhizopus delemar]KAG0769107.1 hypothetical protein G6F24_001354 [Rhizopus arrhizus]KAG0796426.1 hypothetical protein G6F21_001327 [Rhizopus arrhizus]KAG0802030.1 hypothetical protein G6F22_000662 [Rhizopus arrhizus]
MHATEIFLTDLRGLCRYSAIGFEDCSNTDLNEPGSAFILKRHKFFSWRRTNIFLTTAHAEICKLQQENTFSRKQPAPKPSTIDIPPSLSGRTTSPTVSSLLRNLPILSKRSPLPNSASPPPPRVAKTKRDNSQPRPIEIVWQFSSPAEPTRFKLIHVSIRRCLPLKQLRSNLRRLHINTCQILDVYYSNRNLVSFLIHIDYKTELRSQLSKFNITVCDDFDPSDPSIIRNPILINESIDCKVQRAHKIFLDRIYIALQRFRTPIYNIVTNIFVQSGLIDLEDFALYDLASPYKYRTRRILDHV